MNGTSVAAGIVTPHPAAMRRNVMVLAVCQALFTTANILSLSTAALVGASLAPTAYLATLPVALQFLAMMTAIIPASLLMKRVGRRAGFVASGVVATAGAVVATLGILSGSFALFCLAALMFGSFNAFAGFYRFAASEAADEDYRGRAISYVLAGGVLAAFIGPYLAGWSRDLVGSAEFAGSYAALVAVYFVSLLLPLLLRLPPQPAGPAAAGGRPALEIARQPRFIAAVLAAALGFAVMLLVMTATPLAMKEHGHSFGATAFVIQWHVVGMFAPAFFTGALIRRFGVTVVMLAGAVLALAAASVNLLAGTSVMAFWFGLLLLGVAWNFLFIGGTTLVTGTYRPEERAKTQAMNDFLVYSAVTLAALSAGALQSAFGWQAVNLAMLPLVAVVAAAVGWLHLRTRVQTDAACGSIPVDAVCGS